MTTTIQEASADVIAAYIQQMVVEYHNFASGHHRSEPREAIAIPVVVQPCDAELNQLGSELHVITRDISFGGIAVFHHQQIAAPFLRILLCSPETRSRMNLLAKIEHQTKCGGFHIIGCRFVE